MSAVTIWSHMALGFQARKRLNFRFCLIHLKKSSICQRRFIEGGDVLCAALEVIGDKGDLAACLLVEDLDRAQRGGILLARFPGEAHGLVGDDQGVGVEPLLDDVIGEIGRGAGDEDGTGVVDLLAEGGIIIRTPLKIALILPLRYNCKMNWQRRCSDGADGFL